MASPPLQPEVSVITVVRNGERYLAEAIASILDQTRQAAEILVVDGHSTDATAAIAKSFPAVLLLPQPDRGLANARNYGIARARGEFIAFLDHDDVWAPRKLELQLDLMAANPALGYTTTHLELWSEQPLTAGQFSEQAGRKFDASHRPRREHDGATPSALLARRSLFDDVGLFDPTYTIGCDADWFTRVRDRQVPTSVLPEVLVYKRLHAGNLSRDAATNRREMARIALGSIARQNASRT